jgi:hypothetical protein
MTEQYDEIDQLRDALDHVQKMHADSLRELQANEGKLLDKSAYNAKRELITEAHEEASKRLVDQIAELQETTRRNLALLLRYSGETAQEKENWQEAVRLVEQAGDSVQQIEQLCHRAVRWGDAELARALVLRWGGRQDYKGLHEVLAQVDPRVKATYDFEVKHGVYKKRGASSQAWAGWQSVGKNGLADIPGRASDQQPNYLREQRRAKYDQQHGIANKKYN